MTDVDATLVNVNEKVSLDKTKYIEAERKLNGHITSYTKLINDISGEAKLISTNRINKRFSKWI